MRHQLRRIMVRLWIILSIALIAFGQLLVQPVYAISQNDLNSIIYNTPFYDPTATSCSTNATASGEQPVLLNGADTEKATFDFFLSQGLNKYTAAGISGNFKEESGGRIDPTIVEADPPLHDHDWHSNDFPQEVHDNHGYGIAQWTSGGRQDGLVRAAAKASKPAGDLGVQLNYVIEEVKNNNHYLDGFNQLKTINDIDKATQIWMDYYESPGNPGLPLRQKYAHELFDLYKNDQVSLASGVTLTNNTTASSSCAALIFSNDFIQYKQCDDSSVGAKAPWANIVYDGYFDKSNRSPDALDRASGYGTVCSGGCGPSAMAMIITNLKHEPVDPGAVAKYAMTLDGVAHEGGGSYWTLPQVAAEHWGLKSTEVGFDGSKSKNAIDNALRSGSLVMATSYGPDWDASPFSTVGHFLVIRAVTADGKWLVGTSMVGLNRNGWDKGNLMNHPWDPYALMNAAGMVGEQDHHDAWVISR